MLDRKKFVTGTIVAALAMAAWPSAINAIAANQARIELDLDIFLQITMKTQ